MIIVIISHTGDNDYDCSMIIVSMVLSTLKIACQTILFLWTLQFGAKVYRFGLQKKKLTHIGSQWYESYRMTAQRIEDTHVV